MTLQRIIGKIKKWLRALGATIEFSKADVAAMIHKALQRTQGATAGVSYSLASKADSASVDGGGNSHDFKIDTDAILRRQSGGDAGLKSQPSEYGKRPQTLDTSGVTGKGAIPAIDAYAKLGENSPYFKSWKGEKPVIDIDDLQSKSAEEINGKPAVFKVWSAQDTGLENWDMGYSPITLLLVVQISQGLMCQTRPVI